MTDTPIETTDPVLPPLDWNTEEKAALDYMLLKGGMLGIDVWDPPGVEVTMTPETLKSGLDEEIANSRADLKKDYPHGDLVTFVLIVGHCGTTTSHRAVLTVNRDLFTQDKNDLPMREFSQEVLLNEADNMIASDGSLIVNRAYGGFLVIAEYIRKASLLPDTRPTISLFGVLAHTHPDVDVMYLTYLSPDGTPENAYYSGMFVDMKTPDKMKVN